MARSRFRLALAVLVVLGACGKAKPNGKPSFAGDAQIRTANEGDTIAFELTATDPDAGQTITIALEDLNDPRTSATVQPSGAFSWVVPSGTRGTFKFKFVASDDAQPPASAERVETVVVKLLNLPPAVEEIAPRTEKEGAVVSFTVAAKAAEESEPDAIGEKNQKLTYTMRSTGPKSLPPVATLDPDTGKFTWIVGCDEAGEYEIEFKVTDDGTPPRSTTRRATIIVVAAACGPQFRQVTSGGQTAQLEDADTEHTVALW